MPQARLRTLNTSFDDSPPRGLVLRVTSGTIKSHALQPRVLLLQMAC